MGNIKSRGKEQPKQTYMGNINSGETEMEVKSVNDMRNEVSKNNTCSSIEEDITKFKSRETKLGVNSIDDVPNEVIQKNIMVYLSYNNVRSLSMTGSKRLKVIADDVLEKRCE